MHSNVKTHDLGSIYGSRNFHMTVHVLDTLYNDINRNHKRIF